MGVDVHNHVFYGFITEGLPWRQDSDYDPTESIDDRYTRLARVHGVTDPAACDIHWNQDQGTLSWIQISASATMGSATTATPLPSDWQKDPAWDGQLETYCGVMEIPWQQPSWCMVLLF